LTNYFDFSLSAWAISLATHIWF